MQAVEEHGGLYQTVAMPSATRTYHSFADTAYVEQNFNLGGTWKFKKGKAQGQMLAHLDTLLNKTTRALQQHHGLNVRALLRYPQMHAAIAVCSRSKLCLQTQACMQSHTLFVQ